MPKLARNKQRDRTNLAELRDMGWQALVIWECQVKDMSYLRERIIEFLEN